MNDCGIDARCLRHDHHWNWEDLYYESETGPSEPRPDQMDASCIRCGLTLRQSFEHLIDTLNLGRRRATP